MCRWLRLTNPKYLRAGRVALHHPRSDKYTYVYTFHMYITRKQALTDLLDGCCIRSYKILRTFWERWMIFIFYFIVVHRNFSLSYCISILNELFRNFKRIEYQNWNNIIIILYEKKRYRIGYDRKTKRNLMIFTFFRENLLLNLIDVFSSQI